VTLVLDVSNNRTISAWSLKRSGAVGLIAKATEGTSFVDTTYPQHRVVAHSVRVPFGGYLFLHSDSGGNEAEYFLTHARPVRGDIQPVVDAERGLAKPEADRALSCLRDLEEAGYAPILYGSASYLMAMLLTRPELHRYRIWEADYAPRREPLQRHTSVVLWQFTDSYRVLLRRYDASRVFVPISTLTIP